MGISFQCLEELFVWLTKRKLSNICYHFSKSLLAASTVRCPEKYHADGASIYFAKGRVSSVTVISGRLNQSFLHNQASKAVTDEDNRSSLSISVSTGAVQRGRIEGHTIPLRNLARSLSKVSAWPKILSLLAKVKALATLAS
jgi:hypothetical protein